MQSSKNRVQNIEFIFCCLANSAVLLKPNVANVLRFNFCEQKFIQHGPITIAIDCNGFSLLIFEKNGPIMPLDQNPHQTVTRFGANVCVFSVPQMRSFCLFTYPPRSKWASSEEMIFFFAKIGTFCKSIASPLSKGKLKRIPNHIRSAEV